MRMLRYGQSRVEKNVSCRITKRLLHIGTLLKTNMLGMAQTGSVISCAKFVSLLCQVCVNFFAAEN